MNRNSNSYLNKFKRYLKHIPLILISIIWIYPFLWMISTSLKSNKEIFSSGLSLIPRSFQWNNYLRAWTNGNFSQYFLNSSIVTFFVVILVLIMTSMAGYALGRRDFKGKKIFLGFLVGSMFIPESFLIIPLYELMSSFNLLGTLLPLIIVLAGKVPRIFVLLFMGYFAELPKELEEAAAIDGCSFFKTFYAIMLPISKPIIATVVIFQFMWTWNDFLYSLIFTMVNSDLRTVSVGVYSFIGEHAVDWTGMAAASTMSLAPIILIFLIFQKYFIRGLSGSVKG